jgi:hypothetical protein
MPKSGIYVQVGPERTLRDSERVVSANLVRSIESPNRSPSKTTIEEVERILDGEPAEGTAPKRPKKPKVAAPKAEQSPATALALTAPPRVDWGFLAVGALMLLIPIMVAVAQPAVFDKLQAQVFLRIIAALGSGLVGSFIPGTINLNFRGVKVAGALGVFALIYLVDPATHVADLSSSGHETRDLGPGGAVLSKVPTKPELPSAPEAEEPLEKRVGDLAPLIEAVRKAQAADADQQMAARARRAILDQWDKLKAAMEFLERSTGRKDLEERNAVAEHILNELKALAQSTRVIAVKQGQGLVIETAPNTFRVTFPVPMRRVPDIGFVSMPPGCNATAVEVSAVGATIIYSPMTVPVSINDVRPFFSADF